MSTRPSGDTLCVRPETVKPLRVYLRQSKEEQHQKESIPTQRAECERLVTSIGLAASWRDRIEYIDTDRAGDDFAGREQLTRLLHDTTAGDSVVAWKQDRVGRDMIDAAATIRELVKYRQAKLYTAETGTVPVTLDSAEQTAMVMLRGMVAQGELERIRSRTRDGLRQRARDGFACGAVPYGYRTVLVNPSVKNRKESKKRIEIDEQHATIVRRVFAEYCESGGYSAIAARLNREGIPGPRTKWAPSAIWDMLRNSAYAGQWVHGLSKTLRREGKRRIAAKANEADVLRSYRPELAIISAETWERTQARIAARKVDMKARCAHARHPLSGTMRCDACGGPMRVKLCHGRRSSWQRRYYVCGHHLVAARCDNGAHLQADEVETKLSEYLRTDILRQLEDKIVGGIRAEISEASQRFKDRAASVEQLTAELEELRRERQRFVRLASATDDPIPEIVDALKVNQERAKSLERAVAIASLPPLDLTVAQRLEATAIAEIERMRERLSGPELREAIVSLFPEGLRFKIKNGLWLIEGASSVPGFRNTDARPEGWKCGGVPLAPARTWLPVRYPDALSAARPPSRPTPRHRIHPCSARPLLNIASRRSSMIKVEVWIGGTWLPAVLNPREGDSVAWLQVAVAGASGVRTEVARIELPEGAVMRRRSA